MPKLKGIEFTESGAMITFEINSKETMKIFSHDPRDPKWAKKLLKKLIGGRK